jgi:hypothetical protein
MKSLIGKIAGQARQLCENLLLLQGSNFQIAIVGLGALGLKEYLSLGCVQICGLIHQLAIDKVLYVIMVNY